MLSSISVNAYVWAQAQWPNLRRSRHRLFLSSLSARDKVLLLTAWSNNLKRGEVAEQRRDTHRGDDGSRAVITADHVNLLGNSLLPTLVKSVRLDKDSPGQPVPGTPEAIDLAFRSLAMRLAPDLQKHLDTLVGKDFGIERNRELAKAVTRLLRHLDCGLICPHCADAARSILFAQTGNDGGFTFRYEHDAGNRHGGTRAVPELKLRSRDRSPPSTQTA